MISEVRPGRAALLGELSEQHEQGAVDREARKLEADRKASLPPPLTDYQRLKERTKWLQKAEAFRVIAGDDPDPDKRKQALRQAEACAVQVRTYTKKKPKQLMSRNRKRRYRTQANMLKVQ